MFGLLAATMLMAADQDGMAGDAGRRARASSVDAAPAQETPKSKDETGADGVDADAKEDPVDLNAIIVTGYRERGFVADRVDVGAFHNQAVLDVPATVNVVTRAVLDAQGGYTIFDALRNTAGVTRQQLSGEAFDNLAIRGITLQNTSNYRLNGALPINNLVDQPLDNKQRVEVLKGVSAIYYGFTAPGGVVNLITKRAEARPVSVLGIYADAEGSVVARADIGRRFGADGRFGVRINAVDGHLESTVDGSDGERQFVSGAFDWRVSNRLLLKADVEYIHKTVLEQAVITLPAVGTDGRIVLPRVPDPHRLLTYRGANFDATGLNSLARADYALTGDWVVSVQAGTSDVSRRRAFSEIRGICTSLGPTCRTLGDGNARLAGNRQHVDFHTGHARAELYGKLDTFGIAHDLSFGVARSHATQSAVSVDQFSIAQRLYDPRSLPYPATTGTTVTARLATTDEGVYGLDRISIGERLQATVGLRYTDYRSEQGVNRYRARQYAPSYSLTYRVVPGVSLYGSYARGLEQGARAPNTAVNVNEALPPSVSTQKEVGIKAERGGVLVSLAGFDIDRPASYVNAANVFVQDGRTRYRGIEASAQGRLLPGLEVQASGQYLHARFRDIASLEGHVPENTPTYTGSLFLQYTLPFAPDLSVNGGVFHTGRRPVNDANQADLPAQALVNLGARWSTHVLGPRAVVQANVDNLLDKRYYGATGNNRLSVGQPRTGRLTLTLAF